MTDHDPLRVRRMRIDTYRHAVVYLHARSSVCRAEGFAAHNRVLVRAGPRSVVATLNVVTDDLVATDQVGLSEEAWRRLGAAEGETVRVEHAPPLPSFRLVRGKTFGQRISDDGFRRIVEDVAAGRYSDVQLAAFLVACAGSALDRSEIIGLTRAMLAGGDRIDWGRERVVDKHCIGGLPGNRTTPIVVAIAAAAGMTIPKTSSRAITSPAGTADVMAVVTRVELSLPELRRVVEQEGACLAWGGTVDLAPADEVLISVERALDLDSAGQLVASVLSKKLAAGAHHVLIDVPVGPTAKVRDPSFAESLVATLRAVGEAMGLDVVPVVTDGTQPIGRGVGPALEAADVLSVLRGDADAPEDLRAKALDLAARVLAFDPGSDAAEATAEARRLLDGGAAWRKLQAICEAQGRFEPPAAVAPHRRPLLAARSGRVTEIDNRRLARIAKLAGAPEDPLAGLVLHVRVGDVVEPGAPLLTVHAESRGELEYALAYAGAESEIFAVRG